MAAGTKEGDSLLDDRKCRSISNGLVACSMDPKQTLALLCPPRIPPRVRDDVAAKLSISHAIQLWEATVDSQVHLESKKLLLDKGQKAKKQSAISRRQSLQVNEDVTEDRLKFLTLKSIVMTLRDALTNHTWERSPDLMAAVMRNAKEELSNCENGGLSKGSRCFNGFFPQLFLSWGRAHL